jgi:hypothetical protein
LFDFYKNTSLDLVLYARFLEHPRGIFLRTNIAMTKKLDSVPSTKAKRKRGEGANPATSTPSRAGTVNITAYYDTSVRSSLHLIQAQRPRATVRELLAEALNLLFAKYGVPQTAPKPSDDNS